MLPDDQVEIEDTVRAVLRDVLGLSDDRAAAFRSDTPLFGALPELDSMAVAGLLTELEDRLGILIEDDEVSGELLETFGALTRFAAAKAKRLIDSYAWPGGSETLLRFGPAHGPTAVFAPALFEEANRTRALTVAIARALAARGIAAALPDLPGQNESLVATKDATLSGWCEAYAAACAACDRPIAASIRGGALVDREAVVTARWRFAPATGETLVRDLIRARTLAAQEAGEQFDRDTLAPPGIAVELAGNLLSRRMIGDLRLAVPSHAGPIRTVRLIGDTRPADLKLAGQPLWRRSEPDNDPMLAAALADDLADWITRCGA